MKKKERWTMDELLSANFKCAYCGKQTDDAYEMDHILPRSLGGTTNKKNLAFCCRSCNRTKKDRTPGDFREYWKVSAYKRILEAAARYEKYSNDATEKERAEFHGHLEKVLKYIESKTIIFEMDKSNG